VANLFKKGDVVQLKSGGPAMTVNECPGDGMTSGRPRTTYLCVWFKGATRDQNAFEEHLIKKYEPPKK
jgi:uncharacterized protein YodC (DUF2158 family)